MPHNDTSAVFFNIVKKAFDLNVADAENADDNVNDDGDDDGDDSRRSRQAAGQEAAGNLSLPQAADALNNIHQRSCDDHHHHDDVDDGDDDQLEQTNTAY